MSVRSEDALRSKLGVKANEKPFLAKHKSESPGYRTGCSGPKRFALRLDSDFKGRCGICICASILLARPW